MPPINMHSILGHFHDIILFLFFQKKVKGWKVVKVIARESPPSLQYHRAAFASVSIWQIIDVLMPYFLESNLVVLLALSILALVNSN